YKTEGESVYYYDDGEYKLEHYNPKSINIKRLKKANGVIKQNAGASLIDLGDGVLGLEFHSQNNAIGLDIIQMVNFAIDEVNKNYACLFIGIQGNHFCVVADLSMMLMAAHDQYFVESDMIVCQFQNMSLHI